MVENRSRTAVLTSSWSLTFFLSFFTTSSSGYQPFYRYEMGFMRGVQMRVAVVLCFNHHATRGNAVEHFIQFRNAREYFFRPHQYGRSHETKSEPDFASTRYLCFTSQPDCPVSPPQEAGAPAVGAARPGANSFSPAPGSMCSLHFELYPNHGPGRQRWQLIAINLKRIIFLKGPRNVRP